MVSVEDNVVTQQGRAAFPFDLLPGTTPWKLYADHPPPVQNPLLDSLQQYYPRRVLFNASLRQGRLPLWNPFVYCGTPFDPATPALEQSNLYATLTELNHYHDPGVSFTAQYGPDGPHDDPRWAARTGRRR